MYLYWDPVQMLKMLFILRLQRDAFSEENTQLKNRPEPTAKPAAIIQVVKYKNRLDLNKPIEEWNSAHFVKYFKQKYEDKYATKPHFSQDEWGAYALRIHDFLHRHKEEITNVEYKQFIDHLFRKIATRMFKPTIVILTSDKYFYQWFDIKKKKETQTSILGDSGIRTFSVDDVNDLINRAGV